MDALGKREELHDMARRLGSAGYYVMLPNLYYRTASDFALEVTPENREIFFQHMNNLSNSMVVDDCTTLIEFADREHEAGDGPVGCTGYCMSGA